MKAIFAAIILIAYALSMGMAIGAFIGGVMGGRFGTAAIGLIVATAGLALLLHLESLA